MIRLGELTGMLAAVLSSAFGGSSIGATRYLAGAADPLAIGSFRFGIGVLLLAPLATLGGGRWPERRDWLGVAGLGLLFFALFPLLFNASLIYTTAARGALALSTLPLLTMAVGAALGVEALTWRKTIGVLIAMLGVAFALVSGFGAAPPGAWRGDLFMVAAALCMALYGVWSKPFIRRSGPITFHNRRDGRGRRLPHCDRVGSGELCRGRVVRRSPVERGALSWNIRRRADLFPLGFCAQAHDADARRYFRLCQSDCRLAGWRFSAG